jgi:Flp pilus assembly protein TadG
MPSPAAETLPKAGRPTGRVPQTQTVKAKFLPAFCGLLTGSRSIDPAEGDIVSNRLTTSPLPRALRATCQRPGWVAREDGGLTVFALVVFLAMLLVGGIAVDMMRTEHERVRMQNATDRAVVAATMLRSNGGRTPGEIVDGYLRAEGLEGHVQDRVVINDLGYSRQVTAAPVAHVPSLMMQLLGVQDVTVATPAQATEAIARVDFELVLVLDVSGSMAWDDRIGTMRAAAGDFARAILADTIPGQVAISIVPYSTDVRLPPEVLNALPDLRPAENAQSWDIDAQGWPIYTNGSLTYHTDPSCIDLRNWAAVGATTASLFTAPWTRRYCIERSNTSFQTPQAQVLMTDLNEILTYLDGMGPTWGTHIDLGVTTGALLFDPGLRPAFTSFVPPEMVDTPLAGRPFGPSRPNTVRAMILMTDGANCCYHTGDPATRWIEPAEHDMATAEVCRDLRDQGVAIYAVAFLAAERGVQLMSDCASSPNHFFNTDSAGLLDAFQAIHRHIQVQSLRLTQ